MYWNETNSLITCNRLPEFAQDQVVKIAGFDLDQTLISTKSGHTFARNDDDWKFFADNTVAKLHDLYNQGYCLVIFTNQAGIGLTGSQARVEQFRQKIERIMDSIGLPMASLAALIHNSYRKPNVDMWEVCRRTIFNNCSIDMDASFYVGDAAGRPALWKAGAAADHADVDRKFAINCGLRFETPEEFFLNETAVSYPPFEFDPRLLPRNSLFQIPAAPLSNIELLILAGPPSSGKSFYAQMMFGNDEKFVIISSPFNAIGRLKNLLDQNRSVVIDLCNETRAGRGKFLQYAKQHSAHARCLWFNYSTALCRHLDSFRSFTQNTHLSPPSVFSKFREKFHAPSIAEGFDEVIEIPFNVHGLDSDRLARFNQFLF